MEPSSPEAPPPGPHVRGYALLARFDYLKATRGIPGIASVLEACPAPEREQLRGVEAQRWYPFSSLIRLDEAIAKVVGARDSRVFEGLGEASARRRAAWLGPDARLINVHTFLSRLAEEHQDYYSFGQVHYRRLGFREGEMVFSKFPEAHPIFCLSAVGFLRGAVSAVVEGPVTVDERTCQVRGDPVCLFSIRWGARHGAASI